MTHLGSTGKALMSVAQARGRVDLVHRESVKPLRFRAPTIRDHGRSR